ncbi:receptor tyrosine-protein kinase erbB-4-like [Branchiostoma floridae]|uniref:Receptor tyrosine-protein kinase erbB-4-like n=1 Tax=Branchiostoma floridae TaxID=7739 RepID=A0A9J7KJN2_BRAFL|nr:receptor tyrosine-protein kinase erbB-4-like [Branchiostoma floridae]
MISSTKSGSAVCRCGSLDIEHNRDRNMAIKGVILLLDLYFLLCRADEGTNFTVSVFENAEIGTGVVSLPNLLGQKKAELPCVMLEGDRYGRFSVSTNCTVVVARPMDWSVQSEYLLKVRVGGLQDPGHHVVSIKVNVRNVLGYPPVYNETCATPVNLNGNRSKEFLFSISLSAEAETADGDVVSFEQTISKPLEQWNTDDPTILITTDSRCQARIAIAVHRLDDFAFESGQWKRIENSYLSCSAKSDDILPKLSIELIHNHKSQREDLRYLEQQIPQLKEKLQNPILIWLFSFAFPKKSKTHYVCQFPTLLDPVEISQKQFGRIVIVHVETLTFDLTPVGCDPDKYGVICDQICICKNGARCHGFNGACKCTAGWQGVACDIPKPGVSVTTIPSDPSDIYISANVTVHCQVHHVSATMLVLRLANGSEIARSNATRLEQTLFNIRLKDNGLYQCQASDANGNVFNATIVVDIAKCPPNRKGEFCDEACDCLQGAACDWRDGCVCPPGWTGTRCQATCRNGTFGERCLKKCRCRNGASCSPSDGKCTCTAGWYGLWCDVPCPRYRHGLGCQLTCTCKNNATCDNVDGSCTCVAPWTGKNCDEKRAEQTVPLLESLVPVGSIIVLAACVATIIMLYKRRQLCCGQPDRDRETEALLQLEQVESDLAQAVRPGWLRRWGTTSRHLTLGQLVGMGRFGHVIRARLKTSAGDVTVAAKEVRTRDGPCYRSFFREAAILVAVHEDRHHDNLRSNIIQLLALVNESTKTYIVMEYASKGCLLRLLQQKRRQNRPHAQPLPYNSNLRYAVHIARALQELQRLALTHGDVAARNVLITADNVAKLADFGQARDVYTTVQHVSNDKRGKEPADRDTNNVGHEVLPLNWMSVESLETGEYTCQSDVWSFGVLLWEIATLGREPRYGGNNQPTCHQLARTLRRGVRLRRPPDCSGEMYDVMMSCWRESPPERPVPNVLETKLMQMCHTMITEKETTV